MSEKLKALQSNKIYETALKFNLASSRGSTIGQWCSAGLRTGWPCV